MTDPERSAYKYLLANSARQSENRLFATIGMVSGAMIAAGIMAAILTGCTTVASESISSDGTSTTQKVSVPPWGKSDVAKFYTRTEAPTETPGEKWIQEMQTGAEGQSGSDLTALVDLLGLFGARIGQSPRTITPAQPEIVEPGASSQLSDFDARIQALFRRLGSLENEMLDR